MQDGQSTSPRCPHCGTDRFTFRQVIGPVPILEQHEDYTATISSLKEQLSEISEIVRRSSADTASQADEAFAAADARRQMLRQKLAGLRETRASLITTRDRLLAPLRERANQAAKAAFRKKVEQDPTAVLYDQVEEQMAERTFAQLFDKARQVDATFALLLERIELANIAIDATEADLSRVDQDERSETTCREARHAVFVEGQNSRQNALTKSLTDTKKALAQTELRYQAALMYCAQCGASLGAVASPIPFDEWMTALKATAAECVQQINTLTDEVSAIATSVRSLQQETAEGYRSMKAAIKRLSSNLERAVVSSNAQLAKALSGSFKNVQEGMNALVARADQASQRERIEDLRKFFEG